MTANWHLAQLNVGTIRYPHDDPRMHGFMSRLDEINGLAERSPGFVWRLQSDSGNATDIDVGGHEHFLVNMSLWTDAASLIAFVYETTHRDVMIRRREWFERPTSTYQVLWWVPEGHLPTTDEALARLAHLQAHGASEHAFDFRTRFDAPGGVGAVVDDAPPRCSGWD